MGVALVDSNTVVGFLDRDDALHEAADRAIRAIADDHRLIVSIVTYAEVLTGAMLGHHDQRTVRRFLNEVISEQVVLDAPIAERAAALRSKHQALKLPDALILATADAAADVALTGDERWKGVRGLACEVRYVLEP